MNVRVVIVKRATTPIVTIDDDDRIRVVGLKRRYAKPRRYRLLTAIDPSGWLNGPGLDAIQSLLDGKDVLILSTGCSGLNAREWLFQENGLVIAFINRLLSNLERVHLPFRLCITLWSLQNSTVSYPETDNGIWSLTVSSLSDLAQKLDQALSQCHWCIAVNGHVFFKVILEDQSRRRISEVQFIDMDKLPTQTNRANPPDPSNHARANSSYNDIVKFNRMISDMTQHGYKKAMTQIYTKQENGFVEEVGRLLMERAVFGICFVSDCSTNYVDTIQTLRLGTKMSRLQRHLSPSLRKTVSNNNSQQFHQISADLEPSLNAFTCDDPCLLSVENDQADLERSQSLNLTLMHLLDKQKRTHAYLERELDVAKTIKADAILKKEAQIQSLSQEIELMKTKCHQLQSQSPYAMQFDVYEKETQALLIRVHQLESQSSALTEHNATPDHEFILQHGMHSSLSPGHAIAKRKQPGMLKKLHSDIDRLKQENLNLRRKERCYDFYKKQCALLMADIEKIKSK